MEKVIIKSLADLLERSSVEKELGVLVDNKLFLIQQCPCGKGVTFQCTGTAEGVFLTDFSDEIKHNRGK